MENFVNKVAESGIISLDLEEYYPKEPVMVFDLKDHLFMGLILKEKDFRAALLAIDWDQYSGAHVAITCSADAIIPMWANMLVASSLQPVAKTVFFGTGPQLKEQILLNNLRQINAADYTDQRVVVKGCGEVPVPESAYVAITTQLRPYVKSIMYGEPCSTVPIFKKKPA
ncbi:MAG: DUF2480 family protein [Sphingobacteriia bacterium]|nr:DUF2480 family protein [Sphingobacteriia bacterium]